MKERRVFQIVVIALCVLTACLLGAACCQGQEIWPVPVQWVYAPRVPVLVIADPPPVVVVPRLIVPRVAAPVVPVAPRAVPVAPRVMVPRRVVSPAYVIPQGYAPMYGVYPGSSYRVSSTSGPASCNSGSGSG